MRPMNRSELMMPGKHLPAAARMTYELAAPLSSHWRAATCAEVDCSAYRLGWRLRAEGLAPQDLYLAKNCGRRFVEVRAAEGETWLQFEAGQPCFKAQKHQIPLEREPLYLVRGGDWRGNPLGMETREHTRPEHWVEEFAEHQQTLAEARQEG